MPKPCRASPPGQLRRLGKGLYYRSRETTFGPSLPNPAVIRDLPLRQHAAFPAGIAAANLLGFTTQNPARIELATNGLSLPRLIVGKDAIIHTRRPEAWRMLSETDAALLDFLRNRGAQANWPPAETVEKLLGYFREPGRFERLLKIAQSRTAARPRHARGHRPAARAPAERLASLRESLNPLSRFDFGNLAALAHATGVAGEGA